MQEETLSIEWLTTYLKIHTSVDIASLAERFNISTKAVDSILRNFTKTCPGILRYVPREQRYRTVDTSTARKPRTLAESIMRIEEDLYRGLLIYGDIEDYRAVLAVAKKTLTR